MGMAYWEWLILCIILALMVIFIEGNGDDILARVISLIFFIIAGLFLITQFLEHWITITVDKEGLHKKLFGKHIKSLKWEEIVDVKGRVNFGGVLGTWIWFSKVLFPAKGTGKSRNVIAIMISEKFNEAVKYYWGKDILHGELNFPSLTKQADIPKQDTDTVDVFTEEDINSFRLSRRQYLTEASQDVVPQKKKSLSELAAETEVEKKNNPKESNPWDKYN